MKLVVCVLSGLLVGGCVSDGLIENPATYISRDNVVTAGAVELFNSEEFEPIDLANELDPDGLRFENTDAYDRFREGRRSPTSRPSQREQLELAQLDLALAFQAFYEYDIPEIMRREFEELALSIDGVNVRLTREDQLHNQRLAYLGFRRNRVQDRLIASANQRCQVYKVYLTRNASVANFLLGSSATLLGGAGAVFTEPSTTRALSGLASIFSGVRAEYNQDFLHNQTVDVILSGIEVRQARIRREIEIRRGTPPYSEDSEQLNGADSRATTDQASGRDAADDTQDLDGANRQTGRWLVDEYSGRLYFTTEDESDGTEAARVVERSPPADNNINAYSVEMAVADALRYHSACSLASGLDEVEKAVQMVDNPGVGQVNAYLESLNRTRELMRQLVDPVEETPAN